MSSGVCYLIVFSFLCPQCDTETVHSLKVWRFNAQRRQTNVCFPSSNTGYLHSLKYHRTVNLIDYVLRSTHLKEMTEKKKNDSSVVLPRYSYTGLSQLQCVIVYVSAVCHDAVCKLVMFC